MTTESPSAPDLLTALAQKFCATPLPDGVAADLCATDPHYPHPRTGTNLLSVEQARAMLAALIPMEVFEAHAAVYPLDRLSLRGAASVDAWIAATAKRNKAVERWLDALADALLTARDGGRS